MIYFLDTRTYNFFSKFINIPVTNIMHLASFLGSATVLIALVFILFILLKNKKIPTLIAINLATIFILNRVLKSIVKRPRPNVLRLAVEDGYSFPSGHAMVGLGFYGFLIYLIYKYVDNIKMKRIFISALSLLIILIGMSRIYLGVHYTTDIIGAYIFAIIYLFIFIKIISSKFINKKENI